MINPQQRTRLVTEFQRTGSIGMSALKSGMDRKTAKVAEELALMRELPPTRLCEYDEVECRVCSHTTIRVKRVTYSVPARFISRPLRARVYEQHLEVYHGTEQIAHIRRIPGRQAVIDYRHVIQALLHKAVVIVRYHYW